MVAWTDAQKQAIHVTGGDVAVSAGAGAGKTAVLTERCLRLILSGVPMDRLLVITFTESAAQELKARIEVKLREVARSGDAQRIEAQRLLLGRSWISTIHAFCLRVLKENAVTAGLPFHVRVPDQEEVLLTESEIAETVLATLLEEDPQVRACLDHYADGNVRTFLSRIKDLSALADSLPEPDGWIETQMARQGGDDFPAAEMAACIREKVRHLCGQSREAEGLIRRFQGGAFSDYADYLEAGRQELADLENREKDIAGLLNGLSGFSFGRLPTIRTEDKQSREQAKGMVSQVRDTLKKDLVEKFCTQTIGEYRAGEAIVAPYAQAFFRFLRVFREKVREDRQVRDILTFSDFEHRAYTLLTAGDDLARDMRQRLSEHFAEIFVDEFQDVNALQHGLIKQVRRAGAGNLFVVGDLKQSIYQFRLTDPRIFAGCLETVRQEAPERCVALQENFRSRAELLGLIDGIFSRLMTAALDGIGFDETAYSKPGRSSPVADSTFGSPFIRCHLLEAKPDRGTTDSPGDAGAGEEDVLQDFDRAEREAMLVAKELLALKSEGLQLGDGDGGLRPLAWRDCAILFRALKGRMNVYLRVFAEAGIPVMCPSGGNPFESLEIQDLMSLLQVLDNPRQDIPLAALMHSPFGGFNMAVIARLHALPGQGPSFYQRVLDEPVPEGPDGEALQEFRLRLQTWREEVRNRPLPEALWGILTRQGYFVYLAALPQWAKRKANVMALLERARQFAGFDRQGLFRFIRFLEDLSQRGGELGADEPADEAGDAVALMSIHKSKGLEWPVVVLPELGRTFNRKDLHARLLPDIDVGLGLRVVDPDAEIHYPSARYLLAQEKKVRALLAEELRILYVAFTRAKERLLLVGSGNLKKLEMLFAMETETRAVPLHALLHAQQPLDWICRALALLKEAGEVRLATTPDEDATGPGALCEVICHTGPPVLNGSGDKGTPAVEAEGDMAALVSSQAALLARHYSFPEDTAGKAVYRVTEFAHWDPDEFTQPPAGKNRDAYKPSFTVATSKGPGEGRERGVVVHRFLQHMDLGVCDLKAEFERLLSRGIVQEQDLAHLDFQGIEWFLETSLGKAVRSAPDRVRREVPLVARTGFQEPFALIRGVVDGVMITEEGLWVYDFKTDFVKGAQAAQRAKKYEPQLYGYAWALQKIWRKPIVSAGLVFLTCQQIVWLDEGNLRNEKFLENAVNEYLSLNRKQDTILK